MTVFDHEKLDVYQAAIELVGLADDVIERLPRGRAYLADQLQRAATSIPLNIAEGAGESSRKDKARSYRMSLGSESCPRAGNGIGIGIGAGLGHASVDNNEQFKPYGVLACRGRGTARAGCNVFHRAGTDRHDEHFDSSFARERRRRHLRSLRPER